MIDLLISERQTTTFGNQFIVSTIKFRFFEVYDTDSPVGEVWPLNITFISSVEVCNMIADSSKPNKLRNVYTIRITKRHVTIQKRKIYYIYVCMYVLSVPPLTSLVLPSPDSNNRTTLPATNHHLNIFTVFPSFKLSF